MKNKIALCAWLFLFCFEPVLSKDTIVHFGQGKQHKKKDYRDERAHQIMQAHKHSGKLLGGNFRPTADGGAYIDGKYHTPWEVEQILTYVASHYAPENDPVSKVQNSGIQLISHEPYVQNPPVVQKPQPNPLEEKQSALRARCSANMQTLDTETTLCRNTRDEKRWRALQDSREQPVYSVKKYELNRDGKKLYNLLEYDERRYDSCYGNQFQHILYEEFVDIVNETGDIHYATSNQELQNITTNVVAFSDIGARYLDEGFLKEALLISNFCWSMLDCCAAAGKGIVQGFKNTADMITHPIQTMQNLGHAAVQAGHCLGKVLTIILTEQDFCIRDPEEFGRVWKYRIGKIQAVLVAIKDKWHTTPGRDIVKSVATIGTEMVLMNELAAATDLFLTGARNKAFQVAETFEREAEVVLALTADGIPLEVRIAEEATVHFMEEIRPGNISTTAGNLQNKFRCYIQGIDEILPELAHLNANDINHIMAPKHAWGRLVCDEHDWDAVARIISKVVKEGIESPRGSFAKVVRLNVQNELVEVTLRKMNNNQIAIGNAWVNTVSKK